MNTNVGDEGGYAPNLISNSEALNMLEQAVNISGYELGKDINFAIDCAASEFYSNEVYNLNSNKKNSLSSEELTEYLQYLTKLYPIISIEDGLSETDWNGFKYQTKLLGKKIQIVGDDLFVTNRDILLKGINERV